MAKPKVLFLTYGLEPRSRRRPATSTLLRLAGVQVMQRDLAVEPVFDDPWDPRINSPAAMAARARGSERWQAAAAIIVSFTVPPGHVEGAAPSAAAQGKPFIVLVEDEAALRATQERYSALPHIQLAPIEWLADSGHLRQILENAGVYGKALADTPSPDVPQP